MLMLNEPYQNNRSKYRVIPGNRQTTGKEWPQKRLLMLLFNDFKQTTVSRE
jgi:hypothetical protein